MEEKKESMSELERSKLRRIRNRQSTEFNNEHNNPCSKVKGIHFNAITTYYNTNFFANIHTGA